MGGHGPAFSVQGNAQRVAQAHLLLTKSRHEFPQNAKACKGSCRYSFEELSGGIEHVLPKANTHEAAVCGFTKGRIT